MGSSSVIRWMVFHMMAHVPLTWASEINCYFNGEVIGSRRQISLARNVEKHHRFWGARALGSWQSIPIACRLQESVREDTLWSVNRPQRCVVSEFLYVVQWSFKCCLSKVWNILRMISSLNFMPNVGVPFFTHFSGPEVMTSQPEVTTFWGRLGSFCDKISS